MTGRNFSGEIVRRMVKRSDKILRDLRILKAALLAVLVMKAAEIFLP